MGTEAPSFTLPVAGGTETVRLSDFRGKKPVVLVFGSFTCGPFCRGVPNVEKLHKEYGRDAEFIFVYVREAHPSDDHSNQRFQGRGRERFGGGGSGALPQAQTIEQRHEAAVTARKALGLTMTTLVDDMENSTNKAYGAWPDRLYVIDKTGKVAFKGEQGPFGFRPEEMEAALKKILANNGVSE